MFKQTNNLLKNCIFRACRSKIDFYSRNSASQTLTLSIHFRGDPDKADLFGNTALHLAAAQGHKAVVTFLVNFGCNFYAMDIDGRTAQELAGMNNRDDILRFLDGVHAKMEATDKKKAKAMKEKAKKDAEKRIKEFNKKQAKAELTAEKLQKRVSKDYKPSMIETLKYRIKSGSMSNLSNLGPQAPRTSFSAIVSGGTISGPRNMGTVQRKALANKNNRLGNVEDEFKVSFRCNRFEVFTLTS